MCTKTQLKKITDEVSQNLKIALGSRLRNIILYGSYARGDYDAESDIDIMVLADVKDEEIYPLRKIVRQISNDVSLENGTTVSMALKDKNTFDNRISILPFYKNVATEGVIIYGE